MKSKTSYRGTTGLFAQPLGQGLQRYQQRVFDPSMREMMRLAAHWPQIMGQMAAHSHPKKLRYTKSGGVLDLAAPPAFAIEIQHMQPVLLDRVAQALGHRKISKIKLVARG